MEGCGTLQIHMDVEKGNITRLAFRGDYFARKDSDALAERLDELLADDAKRSAFGAQAKRDAEATFLAEQMTRKIEKLYLEAGK